MARRRRIEYEDFAVRIKPDGRGGFVSEVVWAPGGGSGSNAPFVPPFDSDEIEPLLRHLERAIRGSGSEEGRRHLKAPPTPASRRFDPEGVGTRLFRALFRDDVRITFEKAQRGRDEPGLRIRLVIDPRQDGCAEIAALPWELLHDPGGRGFLSLSTRFPIVRFLDTIEASRPRPIEGDLRVLLAISSTDEFGAVDGAAEQAAVEKWGGIRGVHLEVCEQANLKRVRELLKHGEYHVFHFCGHGVFVGGRGALVFEAGGGGVETVDAQLLRAVLEDAPALRLAVLNACSSGRMPRRAGLDPFAGVATALVRSAVPAVIGMQYPVTDDAATRFAQALYASLAVGDPVDAAVAEGRLAIYRRDSSSLEWATPALHLRVRSGALFERRPGAPRRRWIAAAAGLGLAALATAPALWTGKESPPEDAKGAKPSYQRPAWLPNDPRCPAPLLLPDLELAYIPPGPLVLPSEGAPPRYLTLERGLCVARYETDQSQWATVMGGDPPSSEPGHGGDLPATGISLAEAQRFLSWLNERETGDPFRLPSGDEWEYAARGDEKTRFSFGDDPEDLPLYGNCRSSGPFSDHYDDDPAPVGSYQPNEFGLYDMHGNVAEWVTDTLETESGELRRIRRGGSFDNVPSSCEASYVSDVQPDRSDRMTGFRIVRNPVEPGN